jgi:hypothetical protein
MPFLFFVADGWGVGENVIKKIDGFHRKQLSHSVVGVQYNGHSNSRTKLYTRSKCRAKLLGCIVRHAWM